VRKITDSNYFENFLMLLVVMNTILLCFDGLEDAEETNLITQISTILTYIFLGELTIKVIALGPLSN